ncbi:hypothetical protein BIU96_04910 [Curtobacterium sp. MCBA15_008]|nr:hypothetical protein BIU96_04910 [Curtobacterium sp. MCBA15_008]
MLPCPPGGSDYAILDRGRSHYIRNSGEDLGFVEDLVTRGSGSLHYRARRPGGSPTEDVDAVIRISQDGPGSLVTWSAEFLSGNGAGREGMRAQFAQRLSDVGGTAHPPLRMSTYIGGYKTLARTDPRGGGPATWSPTSATLVAGQRDAVLIDALMTVEEAEDLVAWIRTSGKRLTTVIITQGQADHFFGLSTVLRAFPAAIAVAVPDVAERAGTQSAPHYMARWNSLFRDQLPSAVSVPATFGTAAVTLEGHELRLFDVGTIAGKPGSIVSIRDLDAIVGGDLLYNGVHPWLVGTDAADRSAWLGALDLVRALRPSWVIAAHRDPDAPSDSAPNQVEFVARYLTDFERAVQAHRHPAGIVAALHGQHPHLGNISTLHASAEAQFAGWRQRLIGGEFPDLLLPPA